MHVCARSYHPHSAFDQPKEQRSILNPESLLAFKVGDCSCYGGFGGRVEMVVVVVCSQFSVMFMCPSSCMQRQLHQFQSYCCGVVVHMWFGYKRQCRKVRISMVYPLHHQLEH